MDNFASWLASPASFSRFANVRFGLRFQPVDATPAFILSAAVSIRPVRHHLVINRR
jgi:hypothetical protein